MPRAREMLGRLSDKDRSFSDKVWSLKLQREAASITKLSKSSLWITLYCGIAVGNYWLLHDINLAFRNMWW